MKNFIIVYIISCIINSITILYLEEKSIGTKLSLRKKFSFVFFFSFILFFCNFQQYEYKYLITSLLGLLILYYYFKKEKNKIIISYAFVNILMVISEFIYAIILLILFGSVKIMEGNSFFTLITNIFICVISILIIHIPIINKKICNIINNISVINKIVKYKIIIYTIIIANFLLIFIYQSSNNKYDIIYMIILSIMYLVVFYITLNEKSKNTVYIEENKSLLNNLNEYEKMLDYQRIINHENKNQLLVIKSMIKNNKKRVIEYIDEIISYNKEDNELLLTKVKKIPAGGLQGLIYQKMLQMQENGISIKLDINKNVRNLNFENVSVKLSYDICRIVGILLDNAIDATIKTSEKEILISMNYDNDFFIEIANYYKGDIDLLSIQNKGYTSKGKNHGYGLSLLKEIIDKNKKIFNKTFITDNVFTQQIIIKDISKN